MNSSIIDKAVQILSDGGIVIYPTDTAFGIGCRMDSESSVDRLFRIRKRPITQATPVLVSSANQALAYLQAPDHIVRHLMETYWPGALTIIANVKPDIVYSPIRGGTGTIGFREPNHETILRIIEGVGVPVLGPSANFHGKATPFQERDVDPELIKLVDLVVPGECFAGNVSTVLDTTTVPVSIRRQGAVLVRPEDLI